MIDFSKYRHTKSLSRGDFEAWLEDMFQSIFSVEGFAVFEAEVTLEHRIYLLELMIGYYDFYEEESKSDYCGSLHTIYTEQFSQTINSN